MLMLEAAALSVTMIVWTLWGWSIAYAGSDIGGHLRRPGQRLPAEGSMVAQGRRVHRHRSERQQLPGFRGRRFQVAFAMITVGLICGAIAERVKYST